VTAKSIFDQQGCRVLTFALARLSCFFLLAAIAKQRQSTLNLVDSNFFNFLQLSLEVEYFITDLT